MNEQYWTDYTLFIKRTEEIASMSPSDLLDAYETLIKELENADKSSVFEWVYEEMRTDYTRMLIQKVADDELLEENILKTEFLEKIALFDLRMEKFIKPEFKSIDWRRNFSPDYIDWNKLYGE